jgi:hypothetical protein
MPIIGHGRTENGQSNLKISLTTESKENIPLIDRREQITLSATKLMKP